MQITFCADNHDTVGINRNTEFKIIIAIDTMFTCIALTNGITVKKYF